MGKSSLAAKSEFLNEFNTSINLSINAITIKLNFQQANFSCFKNYFGTSDKNYNYCTSSNEKTSDVDIYSDWAEVKLIMKRRSSFVVDLTSHFDNIQLENGLF